MNQAMAAEYVALVNEYNAGLRAKIQPQEWHEQWIERFHEFRSRESIEDQLDVVETPVLGAIEATAS